MTIQRDYYQVLQVDPEASPEVITAAYKTLAKRLHPETDLTGVHEIRMAELDRAYGVLKDAGARQRYDIERADRLNPVGPGNERSRSSRRWWSRRRSGTPAPMARRMATAW